MKKRRAPNEQWLTVATTAAVGMDTLPATALVSVIGDRNHAPSLAVAPMVTELGH